jgi:CubicO group peptidase (beta-lactamase class C family)
MTFAKWVFAAGAVLPILPISALAQERLDADVAKRVAAMESCVTYPVVVKDQPAPCETLEGVMRAYHVPGVSVAVIDHGAIQWAKGFGVAKVGGAAVNAQTLFQAGSISKPVASMGALHLVQQGKLSLDANVNDTLQSWKVPASPLAPGAIVTLRELLRHTSGLGVHGFPGYAAGAPVPTLVQVLNGEKPANTAPVRLESMPDRQWKYSGGGMTVMQLLVQDVTKLPFAAFLRQAVLDPIGMSHSTFEQPLPASYRAAAATPYDAGGNPIPGGAHTYPEQAAAGLWTTPSDLARFAIEIQQSLQGKANHVLDPAMTRQMLTPGKGSWGLGIELGGSSMHPFFDHSGDDAGFEAAMVAYEDGSEGMAVMTNGQNGGKLNDLILTSIAKAYAWPDFQPEVRTAIKLDRSALARYVGTYHFEHGPDVSVTLEGDHLVGQAVNDPKLVMYAESKTKFFTRMGQNFEFTLGSDGRVAGIASYGSDSGDKNPGKRK